METGVLLNIIVSASSVFIAVAVNVIVWMIKIVKIEERVDHVDKKVDAVDKKVDAVDKKVDRLAAETKSDIKNLDVKIDSKIEEVRKESREEIRGLNTKFDAMAKEISFIRGTLEALLKGDVQIGSGGGPSVVRDESRNIRG